MIARVVALEKHRLAPGLQKRFEKRTGFKNRNGFIVVYFRGDCGGNFGFWFEFSDEEDHRIPFSLSKKIIDNHHGYHFY